MGTALAAADSLDLEDAADAALDFEALVHRHQAMVFSIAWHFLRDRSAAEELAQDVFLELHRHWAEMKSPEHMVFWLRRVMSNRCIDTVRKLRNHRETSFEDNVEPTALERIQDPLL